MLKFITNFVLSKPIKLIKRINLWTRMNFKLMQTNDKEKYLHYDRSIISCDQPFDITDYESWTDKDEGGSSTAQINYDDVDESQHFNFELKSDPNNRFRGDKQGNFYAGMINQNIDNQYLAGTNGLKIRAKLDGNLQQIVLHKKGMFPDYTTIRQAAILTGPQSEDQIDQIIPYKNLFNFDSTFGAAQEGLKEGRPIALDVQGVISHFSIFSINDQEVKSCLKVKSIEAYQNDKFDILEQKYMDRLMFRESSIIDEFNVKLQFDEKNKLFWKYSIDKTNIMEQGQNHEIVDKKIRQIGGFNDFIDSNLSLSDYKEINYSFKEENNKLNRSDNINKIKKDKVYL